MDDEKIVPGRRVTNLGENVSEWCQATGEGSTDHDVCCYHAAELEDDPHAYDHILHPIGTNTVYGDEPQGEDGWGGDVEHPPYAEMDPADRTCIICDVELFDEHLAQLDYRHRKPPTFLMAPNKGY